MRFRVATAIAVGLGGVVSLAVGVASIFNDEGGFRWNVWLTAAAVAAVAAFLIMVWGAVREGGNGSPGGPSAASYRSSGPTVGAIDTGGGNVMFGATTPFDGGAAEELVLEIEEMDSRRIPNWGNDWRVSIRITNLSKTADVSAYLLRPIDGLVDPDVGDINLQWDTVPANFTTLIAGKPEQLRIALVSDDRMVRFLSPGEYAGVPGKVHIHNPIKVTESPISGKLRFATLTGGCEQRLIEIHLDHENKPTIHIGDREPCV
jgi:hypothetical protein